MEITVKSKDINDYKLMIPYLEYVKNKYGDKYLEILYEYKAGCPND